ncbi:MAG: DUF1048 domain-containing protein [Clostridiales bacterium]|nr:DUF1048 domain-containing protein [Clostridiales bacterium]
MNNLTKKSKMIIVFSAIISTMLIITIAVLYTMMSKNNTINKESMILIPLIVIIALIAFVVVIYNRKKRNEYTKDLNPEYFEVYENIQDAMKNSNLTKIERKEVLSDITSMLYHAQVEGRDVHEVVGNDIECYTQKVKASFGYRNSILFYLLNGALYLIMILGLLQVINFLSHEEVTHFFDAQMGISIIPYMVVLAFLIVPLTRHSMAKQKLGWTFLTPIIFVIVYIAFHEILQYLDLDVYWINQYLNGDVGFITSYGWLALYVGIAVACLMLKWYLRKRSLKNL